MLENDAASVDALPPPSGAGSADLVAARALGFGYGRRRVFRDLDLDLPRGAVGVLGPAGSGKTTLLELVVTRRSPAAGALRVLGQGAQGRAAVRDLRRRTGYLPRSFGYHPMFTVSEFVEYCGWLKQIRSSRLRERAAAALECVGVTDRANDQLRTLSAGMLRRVGLAQALVHQPELLVLDEPTAGLDPEDREALTDLVCRLAQTTSVLVSGERVDDVAAMCPHLLVLHAGRPVFTGPWHALEARARADVPGDSALERGYAAVLAAAPPAQGEAR
jgi:ABC-2 type transport system ATP-binding protein